MELNAVSGYRTFDRFSDIAVANAYNSWYFTHKKRENPDTRFEEIYYKARRHMIDDDIVRYISSFKYYNKTDTSGELSYISHRLNASDYNKCVYNIYSYTTLLERFDDNHFDAICHLSNNDYNIFRDVCYQIDRLFENKRTTEFIEKIQEFICLFEYDDPYQDIFMYLFNECHLDSADPMEELSRFLDYEFLSIFDALFVNIAESKDIDKSILEEYSDVMNLIYDVYDNIEDIYVRIENTRKERFYNSKVADYNQI